MNYFCTLFDSYYMSRGLAMHESLLRHAGNFHLYIFAFDDVSFKTLKDLSLQHVTVIALSEFENEDLLRVKPGRTKGEYCWTCTPSTIAYCINTYNIPQCTYIDADLYFYSDPIVLLEEMEDKSVLITEHRYTPEYDQSSTSGIYCVQFITFRNDVHGMQVLNWWVDKCIEWCYSRFEDGKFGDQKYLDDWPVRFNGVHVLQHLGGGVAPWNVQQYSLEQKAGQWFLTEKKTGDESRLVFYHFHKMAFTGDDTVDLCLGFDLGDLRVIELYRHYAMRIASVDKMLFTNFGLSIQNKKLPDRSFTGQLMSVLQKIYRKIVGRHQVVIRLD